MSNNIARLCNQLILLILVLVFIAACTPTPMPTPPGPTAVPLTTVTSTGAPTSSPPTVTPTGASTSPPPTAMPPTETSAKGTDSMKIRLKVEDKVVTATLNDSKTTQDFISLLPLTLTLEDYVGTEKISNLPKRLSTEGTPSGSDPSIGNIAYYTPWGNLAIFYKDSGYASGLVLLGKIDSGIEAFNVPGSVKVTIELVR
jgi:hypothetical protein